MGTTRPAQRPNLLYIHSDQHAAAVTGCYGDALVQTPHLDSLAERGVIFTNAYCPSPLCVPSRMATLTGQHPHDIGVWTNDHILDSAIPTVAHAMGAGGYRPVLIGRMHAVGPDQLHGYVERLVGDHGPNYIGGRPVDHGMLHGTAGPYRVSLQKSGVGQSAYQVHDEDVTAATVAYLDRLGVRRRAGLLHEPFSLSVGFMLPHQPFVARREDYDLYRGRMTLPRHPEPFSEALHPHLRHWRAISGIEAVSEEETIRARTAYWALVTRLDSMIGDILAALTRNGLADNTIVLYLSDHGEQVGEHGLWWKQTFYEHSIRVPAILAWPGVLPAGVRCDRVTSSLDFTATMLDMLGCPALPNGRGRSLLPLLTTPDARWEDVAYAEFCTDEGWRQRMVRRDDWKLIYYHGQPPQLFNLAQDPYELQDRAADPACAEVRAALIAEALRGWDPAAIGEALRRKQADLAILRDWARHTQPADQYRWPLLPEMDYVNINES